MAFPFIHMPGEVQADGLSEQTFLIRLKIEKGRAFALPDS
jgi:hypothetical protein